LPTTNKRENFKIEVLKDFPSGKIRDNVYAGIEEQSWVGIALSKEYPWNLQNNMTINQIAEALQIELIEVIREKMSGVYSPMLQMQSEKYPKSSYLALVMFSCKPQNTDKLAKAVMKILTTFQKKGPKKETLAKVKEQMLKKREVDMEKNNFWLGYIQGRYFNEENLDDILTFEESVKSVTNKDIVEFMQKYFDLNSGVRMDMYPENRKK